MTDPEAPHRAAGSMAGHEPVTPGRGRLRLYLGAAPGVGKTYTMLQDAHRLRSRGRDVVVGYVMTHGRARTAAQIGDLQVVPPREVRYRGIVLQELDTAAVIARGPDVALVDELAHTNAPGSRHAKRYQDVFDLLDQGIDVISTMNVQHLESLNDLVEQVAGVRVRETVPDWIITAAHDVELIDMAPEALIRRMIHGNIYPPEQAKRALQNYFTLENLTALRDLALRTTAREVEDQLAARMRGGITGSTAEALGTVMVAVDHRPSGKSLVREGWRMAAALGGDLVVVHVEPVERLRRIHLVEEERQLRSTLQLADEFGATVVRLRGKVSEELIGYARAHDVSQLVIGHSTRHGWRRFLFGSVTRDLLRAMPAIDVHLVRTTE